MNITQDFLTKNPYSRSGQVMEEVRAIALHWVGNPGTSAKMNRDYFESLKNQNPNPKPGQSLRYASAQFIIGLKGEILQTMPEREVAYHVGWAGKVDPMSNKPYTDLAREIFAGKYIDDPAHYSPNYACIGIEMCHTDWKGTFTKETLDSAAELVTSLLKKFSLDIDRIVTHHDVVGWKDCPKYFVDHPEEFNIFKQRVDAALKA